jgi:hypothetical protein
VLGNLGWNQIEKHERRKKKDEKEERTYYYYYFSDAAISNGPHHAMLDVASFACRGWRGNGEVPRTALGQFTTDRHPNPRRDSKPQFQQTSGLRPTS